MKKIAKNLLILSIAASLLSGCSSTAASSSASPSSNTQSSSTVKIVVGATPEPHAAILNLIKSDLQAEGVELEVKEFNDYAVLNPALSDKQIDANFFQHVPYLDEYNKSKGTNLVPVAKVHVEPMGAYSQKIKSVDELKDGATVAIPNDPTNEGRALLLLQTQGLIKLKDSTGLTQTPKDITENSKKLKFSELDAAQLPRTLQDVDLAIINTNYALKGNLDPNKDAIFIEDKSSPYANVLAVRAEDKNSEAIQKLAKALNSDKVRKYIEDTYKGAIVPAF